jgi:boron transporter
LLFVAHKRRPINAPVPFCFPRVLASATYIFCASAIPALAFGEQLAVETQGLLTVVQVLAATALAGIVQSVLGGQPLLILGVAEPIVLIYAYMWKFAEDRDDLGPCPGPECLFLPWAAWVCTWTAVMIFALAAFNACRYIDKFTRFAGELFGALIALLFMQQAIKGLEKEFHRPAGASAPWPLVNGLWGLFLAFGVLLTSLASRKARSWRFVKGPVRGLTADYGVPLLVIAWSGLSFAVGGAPGGGVPSRVQTPNTWDTKETWKAAKRMGDVPGSMVAGALIPAVIISVLFFFDSNVSAQMAQQKEFNLVKPPSYNWDFFLLGGCCCWVVPCFFLLLLNMLFPWSWRGAYNSLSQSLIET